MGSPLDLRHGNETAPVESGGWSGKKISYDWMKVVAGKCDWDYWEGLLIWGFEGKVGGFGVGGGLVGESSL